MKAGIFKIHRLRLALTGWIGANFPWLASCREK